MYYLQIKIDNTKNNKISVFDIKIKNYLCCKQCPP